MYTLFILLTVLISITIFFIIPFSMEIKAENKFRKKQKEDFKFLKDKEKK
jgi:hypothetical protein